MKLKIWLQAEGCRDNPDIFCYLYGQYKTSDNERIIELTINDFVKKAYKAYLVTRTNHGLLISFSKLFWNTCVNGHCVHKNLEIWYTK